MAKNSSKLGKVERGSASGYPGGNMTSVNGNTADDMMTLKMDASGEVEAENLGNATISNIYNSSV